MVLKLDAATAALREKTLASMPMLATLTMRLRSLPTSSRRRWVADCSLAPDYPSLTYRSLFTKNEKPKCDLFLSTFVNSKIIAIKPYSVNFDH